MKRIALFLFGLGSLAAISVSASNISSVQQEPQYQEVPCTTDTICNPAPCNQLPCAPDTVCNPVPCNPGC